MSKVVQKTKRIVIAIVGSAVVIIGIIAIPYPGPGWLIVFAGLGILSTEFVWAKRVLDYARNKYDSWQAWIEKQPKILKGIIWFVTATIVVLTVWLLNGYGILSQLLGLHLDWVRSPLPFFS